MSRVVKTTIALALLAAFAAYSFAEDDKEEKAKPKHTIEEVMEKALKGNSLNKKVVSGQASAEEKLALLDFYVSLVENDAPVGDQASWQRMAGSAALAAAKVAVGREGAEEELKKATNCAACHKLHKPKKKED